jgi:hypothetical protein
MGLFDRWFGKGREEHEPEAATAAYPWDRHPSLYEHVRDWLASRTCS